MKTFYKHLHHFAENTEISRSEMRDIVLTWYEPFKIYSRKVDGSRIVRDVYSFSGASGNVNYDYADPPYDYMIFFDLDRDDFRTVVMKNVYKITKFGKTYLIK